MGTWCSVYGTVGEKSTRVVRRISALADFQKKQPATARGRLVGLTLRQRDYRPITALYRLIAPSPK
jgi:hypothetical protein